MGISSAKLRLVAFGLAAAQTLFWLFTFNYIARRANPAGDGMEWLAAVPMSLIFFVLVVPALILCALGGKFPRTTPFALGFGVLALIFNAVIWTQIMGEFAGKTVH